MTTPLPPDAEKGTLTAGNDFGTTDMVWVVTFKPTNTDRLLSRIAIDPPDGISPATKLLLWLDTTKLSRAPSGVASEYEPYRPIPIQAGRAVYLVWYTNVGTTAPQATLFTERSIF